MAGNAALPFTGMMPPEYQGDILAEQQKQALAQALMAQTLGYQGTPDSKRRIVAKTPLSHALLNSAIGALAGKTSNEAGAKINAQQAAFQQAGNAEVNRILGLPEERQTAAAMGSKLPQAQALAKALQERDKAKAENLEKRLGHAASALAPTDSTAANRVLATGKLDSSYTLVPPAAPKLGMAPGADGKQIPTVTNYGPNGKQELKFGPVGQTINVDTVGEKAASRALGGKVPDVAESSRQLGIDSMSRIDAANKLYNLAKDPDIIAGFGANWQLGAAALGAKLGFSGPEAASKTQEALTLMARSTLEASKVLKGAISDKEKPFLEQAATGGITYTPEAIARIAQLSAAVAHNQLFQARQQWQGATSLSGAEAASQMYPFPDITHTLPGTEKDFPQVGNSAMVGTGGVNPLITPATPKPAKGTAENPMTLEEYQAEQKRRGGR